MLSVDIINLAAGLAEAARTGRVTPDLVNGAVLQLTGMAAQAAALEQGRPRGPMFTALSVIPGGRQS